MHNLSPAEYKECLDLLSAWFDYQDLHAGQGSFARARWAVKKLARFLNLNVVEDDLPYQEDIKKLEHIIEVAEKLDNGEEISEPQPHHRLWSIIVGNRASMRRMAENIKKLQEQLSETQINMHANAHVIIEEGIIPGNVCRCEECKIVAKAMDEAGYLEGFKDRWWGE